MKIYRVWVHIEEIDEDADSYKDCGLPTSVGEFETVEEAKALRMYLMEHTFAMGGVDDESSG